MPIYLTVVSSYEIGAYKSCLLYFTMSTKLHWMHGKHLNHKNYFDHSIFSEKVRKSIKMWFKKVSLFLESQEFTPIFWILFYSSVCKLKNFTVHEMNGFYAILLAQLLPFFMAVILKLENPSSSWFINFVIKSQMSVDENWGKCWILFQIFIKNNSTWIFFNLHYTHC